MISWKNIILLCSVIFIITNCSTTESKNIEASPTSGIASVTISPTAIRTITPTSTPIPVSPTPTHIPAVLPTVEELPENEAYPYLIELLHSQDCQLPCWLNVVPGQTSIKDAYRAWVPLLGIASHSNILSPEDGRIYFEYENGGVNVSIQTRYSLSADFKLIESMSVDTHALRKVGNSGAEEVYGAPYTESLQSYLLPDLLSKYGKPDQVIIRMEIAVAEPTSPDSFDIWLLYPQYGAIVLYTGPAEIIGGKTVQGCPSYSFVSLWLVEAGNNEMYQKTLEENSGIKGLSPTPPYFKSTMDALGMTSDEFFEIYKIPTNRCIESPLEIWPLG